MIIFSDFNPHLQIRYFGGWYFIGLFLITVMSNLSFAGYMVSDTVKKVCKMMMNKKKLKKLMAEKALQVLTDQHEMKIKEKKLKDRIAKMPHQYDILKKKWDTAVKRRYKERNIPFDKIDWEQSNENYWKYIDDSFKAKKLKDLEPPKQRKYPSLDVFVEDMEFHHNEEEKLNINHAKKVSHLHGKFDHYGIQKNKEERFFLRDN